jgi:hypothetical protein
VSLTDAPFTTRRAVYGFIERQNLPAFFRTFDFANPNTHTPERPQTTAPQQALFVMNSPFVIEQAIQLAVRSVESGQSVAAAQSADAAARVRRINRLYLAALGREPSIEELAEALEYTDLNEPTELVAIASQLPWQFGWGVFDEATGKAQFQPLAHFAGTSWQGGAAVPDSATGWAMLSADGGHPGDAVHQVIRRWVAPVAGMLHIEGVLSHSANQGDGVRGRVVASRGGVIGSWEALQSEVVTAPPPIAVQQGETIDFITDCRTSQDFDTFNWAVTLRVAGENESGQVWDSVEGFHGPLTVPLSRWQQLAQVLLMSNEFMFID